MTRSRPRCRRVGDSPRRAVTEGRVEIRRVDPDGGATESYGRLVERARVGPIRLLLTEDAARQMHWILVDDDDALRAIGYRAARAAECRQSWGALIGAPSAAALRAILENSN